MDAEKPFNKIPYAIMIRILSTLGIEGNFFTVIKDIYQNPQFNIILISERMMFYS